MRCYTGVTRARLSQSRERTSQTGRSAGRMMPKAARERSANPSAGTALAPPSGVPSRWRPLHERDSLNLVPESRTKVNGNATPRSRFTGWAAGSTADTRRSSFSSETNPLVSRPWQRPGTDNHDWELSSLMAPNNSVTGCRRAQRVNLERSSTDGCPADFQSLCHSCGAARREPKATAATAASPPPACRIRKAWEC